MTGAVLVSANASQWCRCQTLHDACQRAASLINARIQQPNSFVCPALSPRSTRGRATKAVRNIDACTALDTRSSERPIATKSAGWSRTDREVSARPSRGTGAKLERDADGSRHNQNNQEQFAFDPCDIADYPLRRRTERVPDGKPARRP